MVSLPLMDDTCGYNKSSFAPIVVSFFPFFFLSPPFIVISFILDYLYSWNFLSINSLLVFSAFRFGPYIFNFDFFSTIILIKLSF
jgi:hypothetical protein